MTDGPSPVTPVSAEDRREAQRRRAEDRRAASRSRALVPLGPDAKGPDPEPAARPAGRATPPAEPAAAFAAQLIGQDGQRRGLKGGPPVLGAARVGYLETEYSGPNERRPPVGRSRRTEV